MARFLLVIPAYREGGRLPPFAESLADALTEARLPVEVQVVDDGSPAEDRAVLAELCERLGARMPGWRRVRALPVNAGKGAAVYSGWDYAGDAEWLGFCDADGSVPADEIVRLIRGIAAGGNSRKCVVASRSTARGGVVGRSWSRRLLGGLFAAWARRCTGLSVRDTQCGCKFVSAEIFQTLRPQLRERGFAFDVELLLRAVQAGAVIREVPVNWIGRPGGSLRIWRDGAAMVAAVWKLRGSQ